MTSQLAAALILAGSLSHGATENAPRSSTDWPTLRGNLQRTAFYPQFPKGPLNLAWRKELWRELTGPRAEIIIGDDLAFLGTYAGNFYAWDSATGEQRWVVKTGGPIGHAAAFADGVVFFGSMDRRLRAVEARTGRER